MIDVEKVLDKIDLRQLVARDLGKPRVSARNYDAYRCPLHHEVKGYSLAVYADHWRCFGKCQTGGDAIAWMQRRHTLTFREACAILTSGDVPTTLHHQYAAKSAEPLSQPPNPDWQTRARRVIDEAVERLWSRAGARAMAYLTGRGLDGTTIAIAELGYIPGAPTAWQTVDGLNIPCGILIPWVVDDVVWGIKVRRAAGDVRYQQVAGGNIHGALYLADWLLPGMPIVITEGEFDALIAHQVGGQFVRALAIGSAANARIDRRWYGRLLTAPRILVRMDADVAGENAAKQLAAVSNAVRCVQVPAGKDVNEFYLTAGGEAVTAWLREVSR